MLLNSSEVYPHKETISESRIRIRSHIDLSGTGIADDLVLPDNDCFLHNKQSHSNNEGNSEVTWNIPVEKIDGKTCVMGGYH